MARLRLLRLIDRNDALSPWSKGGAVRYWSPCGSPSTLMMSAPRSPRMVVQKGPPRNRLRSSTRMPCSGSTGSSAMVILRERASLAPPDAGAAVDRQRHAGDETGLVGGEEQRGVRDIPAGAHLLAQRHLAVALGRDLRAGLLESAGAGIDRHRRIHQPG